jgi:hypothetical protein
MMMQHHLNSRFRVFINLNGAEAATITVKNFWGELSFNRQINVRLGKMYRKFGLYNEMLDAVPTYYGIEPPELFDGDHLIVSRTTTFMLHGGTDAGAGILSYSLSTDNGEGGPKEGLVPIGWDINYKFGRGDYTLGVSGYTSGGATTSDVGVGEGSSETGVLPWMAEDKFNVFGGYAEVRVSSAVLQTAYWQARHTATRDVDAVINMVNGANPNSAQLARFLYDPNGAIDAANVNPKGNYSVRTWYVRGGYSFETSVGEVAPYLQWDWYENPETIKNKTFGGDNEAGFADDGQFNKATIGVVVRPTPEVAVKLDASTHIQKFNGKTEQYPEVRFDVSYLFGQ